MASVIDPANDQVHGVAVDQKTEAAIAAELQMAYNGQQDTFALSVKPKLPHKIFYHETRPITFIAEAAIIGEPKEEWLDQVNEIETTPEPFKFDTRHEGRAWGLSLRLSGDSESPWGDIPLPLSDTAEDEGLIAAALEAFVNPEMTNRELHIYLEPHHKSPASEIVWTVDYDKHLTVGLPNTEDSDEEPSEEEEDYKKVLSSIYGPSYSVPDAKETIEKLVQKTQATWSPVLGEGYEEPVPASVAHILEVTMGIKGQHPKEHAWRGIYAHSLDFRNNVFGLIGHRSSDEHEGPWQFCGYTTVLYPQLPNPFYLEMNSLKSQQVKIQGGVGWGRDCEAENQIRLEGVIEKSEQQLTSSSGVYDSPKDQQSLPWYFKQCQVDRTEGQTQSYACQQAISEDSQLRKIKLEFIADEVPESLQNLTYRADLWAKYKYFANLEANPLVSNEDDRVTIIVHYSEQVPEIPLLDIEVHKPKESLVFSKLFWPAFEPVSTLDSYEEVFMDQYYDDDYIPSCDVMEDYLLTFDNVTIELPDNKCQYILAHDTSPDKAFTIIASQIDLEAKTKAVSMSLVGHSIKALPPRGEAVPIVLDGKQHEVTPETPIVMDFDKDNEVRIYVRSTSSSTDTPVLVIKAYDAAIKVLYDGKNIRIEMPRDYQGDQAGLCGDYNDEEYQEFTGPNQCQYVLAEDFANSYAIPGQSCTEPPKPEGPAFCPAEVLSEQERNQQRQPEEKTEDSVPQPPRHTRRPHQPRPKAPEDSEEEQPRTSRPTKPKRPAKPSPSKDSDEEPTPYTRQQASASQEDSDKPSGRPECIQEYTPSFDNKAKKATCFSTQSTYKCQPGCSPSSVKKQQLPFHCVPKGQYEATLKDQAKEGPIPQLQNKKADHFKEVEVPGQCL